MQSLMLPILLDIGGFPPYTLFILKFIVIFFLIFNNYVVLSIILGFLSVIISYYYLKLIKNNYFLILPRSIALINTEDKIALFYHYAIICYSIFLSIPQ
jgi:NADH:ubiquinone oxidoreductase subunit 2 (subunit N)